MAPSESVMPERPLLLNEKFKVHSYDGSAFKTRAQYDVKNILVPTLEPFHCSGNGTKFNLVLKCSEDFTLTHFYISGPGPKCTEPIRSGLVWVLDEPPEIEVLKKYEDMSPEEIMEVMKGLRQVDDGSAKEFGAPEPCVYFRTDATSRESETELTRWREGKYVAIKFLDTHKDQVNIDVGIVALIGFFGRHSKEHAPLGSWMRRTSRQIWVHPNPLKSMFSSSGWVCDGRDFTGGCRSGQTDFHQTNVYTVTYRCTTSGFDLCEKCAHDPTLGRFTEASLQADLQALADPARCKLATNRIRNVWKRNWPMVLPKLFDLGLLETLVQALQKSMESTGRPEEERLAMQRQQGPETQKRQVRRAIVQLCSEIAQRLLGAGPFGGDLSHNDHVWALCPEPEEHWEEGRIVQMPKAPSPLPTSPWSQEAASAAELSTECEAVPADGATTQTTNGGDPTCFLISWRDGQAPARVNPKNVWKMTADEEVMAATASLLSEVQKGAACDPTLVAKYLSQNADLAATNGDGANALLAAVQHEVSLETLNLILDGGACPDVSARSGATPLQITMTKLRDGVGNAALLQQHCEALLAREATPVDEAALNLEEGIARLRDTFGLKMVGALLSMPSPLTLPAEVLEVLQLMLPALPMDIICRSLEPQAFRSLAALLQHFVGSADSLTSAALGCRIMRALVARPDADPVLRRLVHSHGAVRWAKRLSNGKDLSQWGFYRHQHHEKVSGEELAREAKALLKDLSASANLPSSDSLSLLQSAGAVWQQNAALVQIVNGLGRDFSDMDMGSEGLTTAAQEALLAFRELLKNTEKGSITEDRCTAFELEMSGMPGLLLRFLKHNAPMGLDPLRQPSLNQDRWHFLREAFSEQTKPTRKGIARLIKALHAVVETGEAFPVWRHRKERGLRALTEPILLRLKPWMSGPGHAVLQCLPPTMRPQITITVEPLVPIAELSRHLLRLTPCLDEQYLAYCHRLVGCVICDSVSGERFVVQAFGVTHTTIPQPMHTVCSQSTGETKRVLLSLRDYVVVATSTAPTAVALLDFRVALCRLMVIAGSEAYITYLEDIGRALRGEPPIPRAPSAGSASVTEGASAPVVVADVTPPVPTQASAVAASGVASDPLADAARREASTAAMVQAVAAAGSMVSEALAVLTEEIVRVSPFESGDLGAEAREGLIDPSMRVHTVMIAVSEEIPFELFWPMVRDDIMGAVRELCPRALSHMEDQVQAGVRETGMGPIAQKLTLDEAEMVAARVGHVVQTAVTVDAQAVADLQKEKAKAKPVNDIPVGGRIQFSPKGGNSWVPGVIIGVLPLGPSTDKASDGRYDLIDDQGVLWEKLARGRVRLPPQRRESATGSGTPIQAVLSQSDLMRIREHLRRRQEEWADRHAHLGGSVGGGSSSGHGLVSAIASGGVVGTSASAAAAAGVAQSERAMGDALERAASRPTSAPAAAGGPRPRASSAGAIDSASIAAARRGMSASDILWSREGLGDVHFIDEDGLGDEEFDDEGDGPPDGEGEDDDEDIPPLEPSEAGDSQAEAMPPARLIPRSRDGESGADGVGSIEEELRVLEQLRAMEQIISEVLDPHEGIGAARSRRSGGDGGNSEDFLSGPMANLRIRMGGAEGGPVQTYHIRRASGSRGSERPGAPSPSERCLTLRGEFPSFVRALDGSNPTSTLDHPVVRRLGAADLMEDGSDEPMERMVGGKAPLLSVRFCLQPPEDVAAASVTDASIGDGQARRTVQPILLPPSWNLLKAMQFLQDCHRRTPSAENFCPPCFVQASQKISLENWSLAYTISAFASDSPMVPPADVPSAPGAGDDTIDRGLAPMDVDALGMALGRSHAFSTSSQMPAKKRRRVLSANEVSRDEVARAMYLGFAEELAVEGSGTTGPHRLLARCGDNPVVTDAIEMLHLLKAHSESLGIDPSLWVSSELDRKLRYQLEDPLSVVSGTLPFWATTLPRLCPFLFSLKTRKMLLKYTAFGASFAIHWMQESKVGAFLRRRATVQTELNAQTDARKMQELSQELSNIEEHVVRSSFWLGTLQSTIVRMTKGDAFLQQSDVAMELVASSGYLMEVQFDGETGFGSAVTQSFYVEIAQGLQNRETNKAVPMWVEDDDASNLPFLLCRRGLLIRPLVEGKAREEASKRFRFLGRLMGHSLREGFIVPLTLSEDVFGLLLDDPIGTSGLPRPGSGTAGELVGILADFCAELDAAEAAFVAEAPRTLEDILSWRREQAERADFGARHLSHSEGSASQPMSFDQYVSLVGACFMETGVSGALLLPGGDDIPITIENVRQFVQLAVEFWFRSGVSSQVDEFRAGLNEVFPFGCLAAFTRSELREMFCGEDRIEWDEQALLLHLHPVGDLTDKSPVYKFLVAELLEMNQADRSRFLDFVSSCPRLPPGGLAKFHVDIFPDTGATKQGFPRSRACANQLYLPPYTSKEELHEKLHEAMHCSSGHHEQRVRDL